MAKIVIECGDPNDISALEAAVERAAGKCSVTYFKQHIALVEAGKSRNVSQSSKIISGETGETEQAARRRIQEGAKKVAQVGQKRSKTAIIGNPKPQDGARKGAGAKRAPVERMATEAQQFATLAISHLERINADDPSAREALEGVAAWLRDRIAALNGDGIPWR